MSQQKSFTDFKIDFYTKVKDFSIFDCGDFNALKIVLDALKVNYVSKGKVKSPIFGSLVKYELENKLKKLRAQFSGNLTYSKDEIAAFKQREFLISDDGRVGIDSSGKPHSYYFDNLLHSLHKTHCVHIIEKKRHEAAPCDLNYEQLLDNFLYLPLNADEIRLIKAIRNTFQRIKDSLIFEPMELQNIAFAFQNFFNQYKVWSRLLQCLNPRLMFCIVHYHNEGKTLAFKRKGIKVIELQHGLISTKDIFYVFPKQVKSIVHKALYADEIWVYGDYWKEVLEKGVEYVNKIKVAGYYLYDCFDGYTHAKIDMDSFANGNKLILITTQTTMHQYFIEYILWLNSDITKRNLPYKILVKNHPLEKKEHYEILNQYAGIKTVDYPLPVIFEKVSMHVSIYSTTLYDGVRAGVRGFSLLSEPFKDYIDEILQSGVAAPLQLNQNPVDLVADVVAAHPAHYYSTFSTEGLL